MRVLAFGVGLLAIVCWCVVPARSEQHTWKAAQGNFTTVAEFVELKAGGIVSIRLQDGALRDVPLEKLCEEDRRYVGAKTGSAAPQPATTATTAITANAGGSAAASTVTLDDLKDLAADAERAKSASEAARLYVVLLAKPGLSTEVKQAAEDKLRYWQDMAAKQMVRLGRKWVTKDDYLETRKRAADLIDQSRELIRLNQDKLAYDKLVEASKIDPDSIQADFIIGAVYALAVKRFDKASQHFENCRRRDPENIAVLNNLALTEIKLGQVRDAIQHWKAAAAVGYDQRLAHNIGRLIDQAGKRRVSVPKTAVDQLSELYATMLASNKVAGADKQHGWQYMLIAVEDPREEAAVVSTPYASNVGGFGSGFVIAEHYILTNKHVAREAIGFDIIDPARPQEAPLTASLVAVSEEADLAILRCDGLTAPAVPLDASTLRRGTDIMVLGYPDPTHLGAGLKSTRGSISALPTKELGGLCLYDAVTNPGNSGGPVCDLQGNVVAIHCAGFNTASRYGGGVPMETAVPFIQKTLPDPPKVEIGKQPLTWPEVDEHVSKSTVLILIKVKAEDVGLATRVGGEYLEDRSCNLCNGSKYMKCPFRKCSRGTVPEVETVVVARTPQGAAIYGENTIRVRCPNCFGKGVVTCGLCNGLGVDPDLR